MKNIKPKKDFVLIEIVEKKKDDGLEKTKGGLYIPGRIAAKTTAGFGHSTHKFVVRDVGPEVENISVNDLVVFSDRYANSIQDEDDKFFILLKEEFIYATYDD